MNAPLDRTSGLWALSAADLAANLLCFFVLQFAMSEMDVERFRAASLGIGRGLGIDRQAPERPQATLSVPVVAPRSGLSVDYLSALLGAEMVEGRALFGASLKRGEDRLSLSFPIARLFAPHGEEFAPRADEAIFTLAGLLARVPNRIEIVARTASPADGLEGALKRARTISRALRASGYDRALGFGGGGAASVGEERIDFIIDRERTE